MQKPKCRLCGTPHWANEAHAWNVSKEVVSAAAKQPFDSAGLRGAAQQAKRDLEPLVRALEARRVPGDARQDTGEARTVPDTDGTQICRHCGGTGRKRYKTQAEKQKAYRERKALKKGA